MQILQDYELTENNITKSLEHRFEPVKKNYKSEEKNKNVTKMNMDKGFFIPRQKDSLFWCFYIMKNGDVKYELLGKINSVIEKKFKIDYVEKIRTEKQLIKSYKFASLSNIENKLANDITIDLKTFLALCVMENVNIIYINKRTYYELLMNDSNDIFIINNFENSKFGYKVFSKDDSEIEYYRSTLFKIENIDKPIKSITSYKLSELIDYCEKLQINITNKENGKPKLKKDLYELIIQYF
jgi:hypothetical protein